MTFAGDMHELRRLIAAMQSIASGEVQLAMRDAQAEAARTLVSGGFDKGQDPYGREWARKKNGERCYLTDTGALRSSLTDQYKRGKLYFTIESPLKYAVYYQSNEPSVGAKRRVIRRPMVPTEKGLGKIWQTVLRDAASERMMQALSVF